MWPRVATYDKETLIGWRRRAGLARAMLRAKIPFRNLREVRRLENSNEDLLSRMKLNWELENGKVLSVRLFARLVTSYVQLVERVAVAVSCHCEVFDAFAIKSLSLIIM